jgi:hypothetical protein
MLCASLEASIWERGQFAFQSSGGMLDASKDLLAFRKAQRGTKDYEYAVSLMVSARS